MQQKNIRINLYNSGHRNQIVSLPVSPQTDSFFVVQQTQLNRFFLFALPLHKYHKVMKLQNMTFK